MLENIVFFWNICKMRIEDVILNFLNYINAKLLIISKNFTAFQVIDNQSIICTLISVNKLNQKIPLSLFYEKWTEFLNKTTVVELYQDKTFIIASLRHIQQCWQQRLPGSSFFGESRAKVFKI